MAVKIAYNNTPSMVLLCKNRVKLEPAGMLKDHAELTEDQQKDPGVVNWAAQGKILLLSMDEAEKRENRRKKAVPPSAAPRTSVTNPAAPPKLEPEPEPKAKEPEPEPKAKEPEPVEELPTPETAKKDDTKEKSENVETRKGKKGKKSRRG